MLTCLTQYYTTSRQDRKGKPWCTMLHASFLSTSKAWCIGSAFISYFGPPVVELEVACFSCRVLNSYQAPLPVIAGVFNDVKPEVILMNPGALVFRAGQDDLTALPNSRKSFDLHPANRLIIFIARVEIKAGVTVRSGHKVFFTVQNESNGLF